ncbi:Protein of uncharacterised function (DUF551) [Enterobacter hormaechei]|uniref:DUF551 domain-containing protein n=1 Tax=Enterobacter hormaechei TaxID=158836 RepID=UPI00079C8484|nr:DUF551 domain-containing protein [Enterobacter hormaechei]CZU36052.1 Protein of uncharacterised function (DUF551) [Enterobacter hormaechei]CZV49523.1 Protein of uncharacterised function (DUF551) [Enterobacter hormaechei]CZW05482.1 Protein of uncharacterised function (DUF551) [Enterobacter hormaechei]CZZ33564.1 Protein of uncharacterised function (DUF551) [Enterobacter hormaechei]SAB99721.1 Protein of uncharacterised function (DUF551) [Enterobacter hormaechei]
MSTMTKERAAQIAAGGGFNFDEIAVLARIALASLEEESVAEVCEGFALRYIGHGPAPKSWVHIGDRLYTAPPAPMLPEEMPKGLAGQIVSLLAHNIGDKLLAQKIWNACRAALLQGAEPVTTAYKLRDAVDTIRNSGIAIDGEKILAERDALNCPVITDGWVACSERMPEDGEKVLTSFRGGMRTAVCKVVDVLGHKIFVDELTLFNGVPADHWQPLPAAPQQEA